jgi:hypothetical protein
MPWVTGITSRNSCIRYLGQSSLSGICNWTSALLSINQVKMIVRFSTLSFPTVLPFVWFGRFSWFFLEYYDFRRMLWSIAISGCHVDCWHAFKIFTFCYPCNIFFVKLSWIYSILNQKWCLCIFANYVVDKVASPSLDLWHKRVLCVPGCPFLW